ncbi:uncharacterized protein LOC115787439 [Archocentrus centrarchus]|nr:uncharacterized protein LOC115787439 [Archocentrus centrarchus]
MRDDQPDWLITHQERLRDAHARARECAERKAAGRVVQQQEKVYCPPVGVGQEVYLRHRPPGRNKIQDAWAIPVYKVVEVHGTTYTVEPLEGGPKKRVHRSNLRPCVGPVPVQTKRHCLAAPTVEGMLVSESESESDMEPDFVLMEEVRCSQAGQEAIVGPDNLNLLADRAGGHQVIECEDVPEQRRSETPNSDVGANSMDHAPPSGRFSCPEEKGGPQPVPAPRGRKERKAQVEPPVPPPRRSERETAGRHRNMFHLPRSACNSVSFSPDVFSQILAGVALYTSNLREGMGE